MLNHSSSICQAMILAAGKGTRLRPLTLTTPKPLVAVGGQPLIVWHILALKQVGITDITINASWLADVLQNALGTGEQFGVNIHWSLEQGEPLETAGGIRYALGNGALKPQPFLLINGDIWTPFDFSELLNHSYQHQLAHLLLTDQADHNPQGDFALENGFIRLDGKQKLTFSGISVLSPQLFDKVMMGETMPLRPLLHHAIRQQQVTGDMLTADWLDVGTLERLDWLNQHLQTLGCQAHRGFAGVDY